MSIDGTKWTFLTALSPILMSQAMQTLLDSAAVLAMDFSCGLRGSLKTLDLVAAIDLSHDVRFTRRCARTTRGVHYKLTRKLYK